MPLQIHTYAILILFNEFLDENAKPIFFQQIHKKKTWHMHYKKIK